jgi:hypothetical protein
MCSQRGFRNVVASVVEVQLYSGFWFDWFEFVCRGLLPPSPDGDDTDTVGEKS